MLFYMLILKCYRFFKVYLIKIKMALVIKLLNVFENEILFIKLSFTRRFKKLNYYLF